MAIDVEKNVAALFATAKVLIVDDEAYMRKVIRTLLISVGIRNVTEAPNGLDGLDAIRTNAPDVVILDWEMPAMDGAAFTRMVRSPETFPHPAVPIIMLTGHGERRRVLEAIECGVHEFLLKPVSSKALQDRLYTVLAAPRPMVRRGNYYGPEPRKVASYKPEADQQVASIVMVN